MILPPTPDTILRLQHDLDEITQAVQSVIVFDLINYQAITGLGFCGPSLKKGVQKVGNTRVLAPRTLCSYLAF